MRPDNDQISFSEKSGEDLIYAGIEDIVFLPGRGNQDDFFRILMFFRDLIVLFDQVVKNTVSARNQILLFRKCLTLLAFPFISTHRANTPKKIPPVPFGSGRDNLPRKTAQLFVRLPHPPQVERYSLKAGFLARFVARVLCLPGLPSGLLSKSRSPYSCGTAQALHLFFRNRGAVSYSIFSRKKRADASSHLRLQIFSTL